MESIIKSYRADAALTKYRVVKWSTVNNHVIQSAANSDVHIGVVTNLNVTSGQPADVVRFGPAEAEYGDTVTRGDYLTSDSVGRVVKCTDTMLLSGTIPIIGQADESGTVGQVKWINVFPGKISKTDGFTASAAEVNKLDGAPLDATITVGAEGTNAIDVTIQLKDANGDDLAVRGAVRAYLSNDANGDSIITTAPSGHVAIKTDGVCAHLITDKVFELISESDGDIDLTITEAGALTCYLILILPNGKLKASGAITFAA